jgi:DNA-binding MarR family transcriptional regulator
MNSVSMRDWMGALKRMHEGAFSLVHLNVLVLVSSAGPLTMSQLADQLDVSVASATGIVDRMEKKGVVERRRNERDRRVVEVHVTEQGRQMFSNMQTEREARLVRILETVPDDDLAALAQGMRAFCAARDRLVHERGGEGHSS